MENVFGKKVAEIQQWLYLVFRVIIGAVFFLHGQMKIFSLHLTGLMGVVGVAEMLIGLGLILAIFTRLAAVGGLIIMIGALVTAHLPSGWNPIINKGEPALLFLVAFLILLAYGAGIWSLERQLWKKEMF